MSSNTSGVSPFFGGLYSGSHRRPSMFTAKYRLREERKKVMKMSLAKIKRIEDPESFLRRSVLINNTMKQLQNDVHEEKMMRHGVGYHQRFSQCLPYRKSFVYSRLNQMHLSLQDELDSSDMDTSSGGGKTPTFKSLMLGTKSSDDSKDGCDLQAIFSKTYAPPTPLLMPTNSIGDSSECAALAFSQNEVQMSCDNDSEPDSCTSSPASKKARTFIFGESDGSALVDISVDGEVAVPDKESIDWPTSATTPTFIQCSLSTTLPSSSSPISPSSTSSGCALPSHPSLTSSPNVSVSCLMSSSRLTLTSDAQDDNAQVGCMEEDASVDVHCNVDVVSVSDCAFGNRDRDALALGVSVISEEEQVSSSASDDFSLIDLSNVSTVSTSTSALEVETPTVLSSSSISNDFVYTPPISVAMPIPMSTPTPIVDNEAQSQDDINFSSDMKENKFTLPVSSSNSSSNSTDSGSCPSSFSNPITNISSLDTRTQSCSNSDSHNCSHPPNNPTINTNTSESSENTKQKFSCGHSSVFGELQSVVFHSLIASLES